MNAVGAFLLHTSYIEKPFLQAKINDFHPLSYIPVTLRNIYFISRIAKLKSGCIFEVSKLKTMISITVHTPKGVTQDIHDVDTAILLFVNAAETLKLKCDPEHVIKDWLSRDGIYSVSNEKYSITLKS